MADTDTLLQARNVALDALVKVASDLVASGSETSTHSVVERVTQITALQTGVKALDDAINTSRQYRPEYK